MSGLRDSHALADIARQIEGENLPPVYEWDPPHCGVIDISIKADGSWHYQGSPISRTAIVKLFAGIMRRQTAPGAQLEWFHTGAIRGKNSPGAGYALVTPVEKLTIEVEDAPFVGVAMEFFAADESDKQALVITTNLGDRVIVSAEHPIKVHYENEHADPRPYVLVRDQLPALLSRTLWYQLVDIAADYGIMQDSQYGIVSAGSFIALGSID